MARKATQTKTPAKAAPSKKPAAVKATEPVSTPVRHTPIPKVAAAPAAAAAVVAAPKQITHEMIARRAFEIYCSGAGGNEFDHWCQAERELRGV